MKPFLIPKKNPVKTCFLILLLAITFQGLLSCQKQNDVNKSTEITEITLDTTTLELFVGDTAMLVATVLPDSATDKTVRWSSTAETIVKVNASGKLTAIATGTAIIKATAGNKQAVCSVTVNPDIYVAGDQAQSPGGYGATIWKNGIPTTLTSYMGQTQATSVFVSGSNVYVAGNSSLSYAAIWKNTEPSYLTNGKNYALASSVYVSGNDVYAAGFEYINAKYLATLWKNGTTTHLTDGTKYGSANAVCVSGNDVYVVGEEITGGSFPTATVWKNGVPTRLTGGATNTAASSIFISGNDVYVAGGEVINSVWVATVWKNGTPILRLNQGVNNAEFKSIFVSGNDVYVAGSEYIYGSFYIATVWKNGVGTRLTDGTDDAETESIYVWNNDVYLAGYEKLNGNPLATVWKNGKARHLDSTNTIAGMAFSIFVKEH